MGLKSFWSRGLELGYTCMDRGREAGITQHSKEKAFILIKHYACRRPLFNNLHIMALAEADLFNGLLNLWGVEKRL